MNKELEYYNVLLMLSDGEFRYAHQLNAPQELLQTLIDDGLVSYDLYQVATSQAAIISYTRGYRITDAGRVRLEEQKLLTANPLLEPGGN